MKPTLEGDEKVKEKRGGGAYNKVPVFGLLKKWYCYVKAEVIKDVTAETLLNLTVKMVRRGSMYIQISLGAMMPLCSVGINISGLTIKRFSNGKVYINGLERNGV